MAYGDQISTVYPSPGNIGPDPNVQTGVDQYGNPINGYGLPLGRTPAPAAPAPGTQTPVADPFGAGPKRTGVPQGQAGGPTPPGGVGVNQGTDDSNASPGFMGFGDDFMGRNPYRPGGAYMTPASMTAAQMTAAGMNTQQADTDRGFSLQSRDQQQLLGNAIMDRAMGRGGPSVAELQMQRGIGQAQQAAARQAASARGINRGLASYGAMNAQQNMLSQGIQDAAALRAQEQIAAQGLAQRGLADQRMQDLTSRGMSIQQAQAIMDAENRAREANMAATNQARQTNVQSANQAGQTNVQAETARQTNIAGITEGEAQRGQKGAGGIVTAIGALAGISDIRAKQDVQPLLYAAPFAPQGPQQNEQSISEQARNLEQDRRLGLALTQMGQQANVGNVPPTPYPTMQPAPQMDTGGFTPPPQSGGGIGDILGGLGANLSDKRAKNVAFQEGLRAGMRTSPMAPGYTHIPPPGYAVSDKRAKSYSYSDERAKTLEGENAALREALSRMGNDVSSQVRGDAVPTARFADVSAEDAREGLGPVNPYQFSYKPEFAAAQGTDTGMRNGVMAQEMQKSPAFKSSVVKMPNGMLGLDNNRLLHADTAMIAGQDKRLSELEEQNRRLAEALSRMGNQRAAEIRDF